MFCVLWKSRLFMILTVEWFLRKDLNILLKKQWAISVRSPGDFIKTLIFEIIMID